MEKSAKKHKTEKLTGVESIEDNNAETAREEPAKKKKKKKNK